MKVAIIGAGFGGLAAALRLAKAGVDVTVFEKKDKPGGLAIGFREPEWEWSLEEHYHHWFRSDSSVLNLAREIGHKVVFIRPKTSTYYNEKIYQLDSPLSLMQFGEIDIFDRLRTALVLAFLKFTPYWKPLENVTAEKFLRRYMGERSWKVLWEPLFEKKFSSYGKQISAAWFWARIKKRSSSLGYPEGGFLEFAQNLEKNIQRNGGRIQYKTVIKGIKKSRSGFIVEVGKTRCRFERVICTLPTGVFAFLVKDLPESYRKNLLKLKGIGAINLVISLNKRFFQDNSYWLSVNDMASPFVAVVEHTNFMDKKHYNNENLVYVANYLKPTDKYYNYDAKQLLDEYWPALTNINPKLKKTWIKKAYIFKANFAQPIFPLGYSKLIPQVKTPIAGLYLANMQQVYPWDRGTNYAVEQGFNAADQVIQSYYDKK